MSVKLHIEVPEELLEKILRRTNAKNAGDAVLEALDTFSKQVPSELLIPMSRRYPADPDIRSQKDLIKYLGTFETLASDEEFEAMRAENKWPSAS